MNLQQLRIIREAVRQDFNLTEVANTLYTSQPGVSKHIKDLEDELGIEIFVRRGKRLIGLTAPGRELVEIVERILIDLQNLQRVADQFASRDAGGLVIATTHTQARYALPDIIKWFKSIYPKVHLTLLQCSPPEIVELIKNGNADIGIATEAVNKIPDLISFPCYSWHHAVIVPHDHDLARKSSVTIEDLMEFPIVTYHEGFTGRDHIDSAFAASGAVPDIVLSAIDADVIKTYVVLGMGVGIIASIAYNTEQDGNLHLIEASNIFSACTTHLAIRRGAYLRNYAHDFIMKFCSQLNDNTIREALKLNSSEE
jgi:LysR family cys regulon transcriptional activator